ncbi:ornithine cyclodeaminase family protein [Sphingosinicella sp. CPCC 101087]|uniref:ornithine cyclodeaminase family protein n=1 Tax=Sphingosinicella sp. CPCC 101087 TaxID=2497754 RepID=UPI00101D4E82|nr:ornithine cyclodeaminase family protein [Sphingosinicella sp. CPCC 101087]
MNVPAYFDEAEVYRRLDYDGCIAAMREAMTSLSADAREQPLRSIVDLGESRLFGLMPGMMAGSTAFGAKLISVFPDPVRPGRGAHRGLVILFEGEKGEVRCVADAGAITQIRTGCASAVAADALARPDASSLAIYGCGTQARSHIEALTRVRRFTRIGIWGRDAMSARRLALWTEETVGIAARVFEEGETLAEQADVICTVTSSAAPILKGRWVRPGTHINAVGSSHAGPREVDTHLVAVSRYFVDYRRSALAAAAEFLVAREEGVVTDAHIRGEIGEVLSGRVEGRRTSGDITFYKSLGHIAQDLAAVRYLLERANPE